MDDVYKSPILEIITDTECIKVWADGRIDGLPEKAKIINLIPLVLTDLHLRCDPDYKGLSSYETQ